MSEGSHSLRHPGRVFLVVVAATAINFCAIDLPAEAHLFFGPFLYMPLVLVLGWPWAILAAAAPMAVTIFTLGHPFPFMVATLEAVWLSAAARHSRRSSILQDLFFWVIAGAPAVVALYGGITHHAPNLVAIVAVKQLLNQFAAVAVAVFLLRYTRLAAWIDDRATARRRMRDIVFHSVFVLALVPLALVGVGMLVLLRAYAEREDREVLTETAQREARQMDLFLSTHEAAVISLAGMLSRASGDPAAMLAEVQRAHPAFTTMLVADETGLLRYAAPVKKTGAVNATNISDRLYFQKARDRDAPFVSGVFRGRGFGRDVLVAISAPVHDAQGRFRGVVEASLEVQTFTKAIVEGDHQASEVDLIFADPDGRVIYSAGDAAIPSLAALRHFPPGELLSRSPAATPWHFDQVNAEGRRGRLAAFLWRSEATGMIVIAQRPMLAGLDGSGWMYGLFGAAAVGIVGSAVWVARNIGRRASAPLEYFSAEAGRQTSRNMVEPIAREFEDVPYEVWSVFHAFNQLAVQLRGSYAMLLKTNEELDRRVSVRTTEAEAARRQAEQASQSKTDFLAMTSHEIRTPLNAIIGLAEALTGTVTEPVAAGRLRTIHRSGVRLLGVVNDLLDLSRVEAGKLELRPATVELGALCGEVLDLFAERARGQGLRLDLEIEAPRPLWIESDAPRLQQVLVNLVGNALKFTPAGRICLRVKSEEESAAGLTLCFSVSDTGPGIPLDQQARLFQPYVQLDNAAGSAVPGTGLGLAICRRIVALFGGTLALRSEVGAGTEFFFRVVVPRGIAPASAVPESVPPLAAPVLRLLAVDDNLANQEVLRSILERHCAHLVIVDRADAALAELARAQFDVALVDLEMPEKDGFAVARTVRSWTGDEVSRACRLVALSAHQKKQLWPRCAASGFDEFVEKPIDRTLLLQALRPIATLSVA